MDRVVNRGNKQTGAIVMDFSKAFGNVLHKMLLYKLDFYGIRGHKHKQAHAWLLQAFLLTVNMGSKTKGLSKPSSVLSRPSK